MTSFNQRVISRLLNEGWNIQHSNLPFIDFFSVRRDVHSKKAYRVKAHGHISHKEQKALHEYGKQTGIPVIYVHEIAERELEFIRLYPRNIRNEGEMKEK